MSIMVIVVVLSVVYKTYVSTTNVSLETQQKNVIGKMETSFQIVNGSYDDGSSKVKIYLKNTGSLKLDPSNIDIYSGSGRIARDAAGRDIDIVENFANTNHWDPGELVVLNVSESLTAGSHLYRLGVENGITRSVIIEA